MSTYTRLVSFVFILSMVSTAYAQYFAQQQQQQQQQPQQQPLQQQQQYYYYAPAQQVHFQQQWHPQRYQTIAIYYPPHVQQQRQPTYLPRPAASTAAQVPPPQPTPRQEKPRVPTPTPSFLTEKKKKKTDEKMSAQALEFDLPPAPPSRFLPEDGKVLTVSKHGRPEHVGALSRASKGQLVAGATEVQPNSVPELAAVHVHHIQVPRIIQRPVPQTPAHVTHHLANPVPAATATSTARIETTTLTTTAESRTTTTATASTTTTLAAVAEEAAASHLSPRREKRINPNKVFLQCCKRKKVAKICEPKCNFDNISKKALTSMFLGTDTCPQAYGLDLFSCAAQEDDHTKCCETKNVQRTSAGLKCLAFCNLTPESQFQADASYLPCWAVLNEVKACFKDAILYGKPTK